MNFKTTLWVLAFACAAFSCSDELVDGPGNNPQGGEEQGEGVYLTINVATPSGLGTKADPNTAEEGSGNLQGSVDERAVNDINIYLVEATNNGTGTGTSAISDGTTGLAVVNASADTKIVGHGYFDDVMENDYNANIDHTANTVRVIVNEAPSAETVYHVLAVANFGKSVSFSTLGELRDAVAAGTSGADWSGNAFTTSGSTVGLANATSNFVMSTHQMWEQGIGGSSVKIGPENMDETNPAQATVFIERLAARIDLNLTSNLVSGNDGKGDAVKNPVKVEGWSSTTTTSNTTTADEPTDYVKLTGYQVVNRWNGDNYLLKRVTATLTVTGSGENTSYPVISTEEISYLGDEVWGTSGYNYVIDPLTTGTNTPSKNGTNVSNATLTNDYESHYDANLNSNISTAFRSVSGEGSDNISTTTDVFTPVFYTKENCLDLNNQIMGLVTGIIFKGEYTPNAVSTFDEDGGNSNSATVKAETYTEGDDFYVVNDFSDGDASRFLTSDLTTIGALSFTNIANETYASGLLKALFGTSSDWGTLTSENLQAAVNAMIGGKLNMAYKEYLQGLIDKAAEEAADATTRTSDITITLADAKWSAFLASTGINITDPSTVTTGTDAYATSSKALYDNWNISYYKDGVCYFPYWIRHENNDNNALAGPMEFCIVRNNVYQVGVSGVNALGYPLPFVKPGDTPVEAEEVYLQVQIYVKDWTLRKNSGITL